jgi:hypothetical protein
MRDNWVIKFIPLVLIWGSSFFLIELSLEWTTAVGVAFWRTALGALAMIIITYSLGLRLPSEAKQWLHLLVAGFFMSAFPFTMYAFAQQYTTSILAAILNATTPMFTLLATFTLFRAQKQNPTAIIGLLVGLVGVGITLGIWQGFGTSDPIAILALIAASISYGVGTPYIRKYACHRHCKRSGVDQRDNFVAGLPIYRSAIYRRTNPPERRCIGATWRPGFRHFLLAVPSGGGDCRECSGGNRHLHKPSDCNRLGSTFVGRRPALV